MAQQDERISRPTVAFSDEQIEMMMVAYIGTRCLLGISEENKRLTKDIILLDDAIAFHGIDKWSWVGSVIEELTDKTEVDKMMEDLPPQSKIYRNYAAIAEIVNCLSYWRREQVISEHDTMLKAVDILIAHLIENMQLLGSIP